MTTKLSLRLKLSDFINSEIESKIMEKINNIHNELRVAVLLHLWYEDGEVATTDLKNFLMKWEKKLSFKTIVTPGSTIKANEFIWFDIIPTDLSYTSRKRFQFKYSNTNSILNGLQQFYEVAKFTTSDKPVKQQKRNDYED